MFLLLYFPLVLNFFCFLVCKFERRYMPLEGIWSFSKRLYSFSSSAATLLSTSVSVPKEVNIGNNGLLVIFCLSAEAMVFLVVFSSVFPFAQIRQVPREFLNFPWACFMIFISLFVSFIFLANRLFEWVLKRSIFSESFSLRENLVLDFSYATLYSFFYCWISFFFV